MKPYRVRFAPSPTGPLNIGGLRTALYDYLLARKHGGQFILRIEDTDQKRFVEGTEEYIMDVLRWCDIVPDEGPNIGGDYGPYRQSERSDIYKDYVQQLLDAGYAYYAFDTAEELEAMRTSYEAKGEYAPKYDHTMRHRYRNSLSLPAETTQQLLAAKTPYTIRMRIPIDEVISFQDHIRGKVAFNSEELDDKVIMKADGLPTYHLANVVDDYLMKISHVIRGEEWLSSTAHHILLYRFLNIEEHIPEFIHLPLLLKPSGKGKLSKRDATKFGFPVFPIEWNGKGKEDSFEGFRESGYLPQALINFLVFLGWNPGTDQELFDMPDLIAAFSVENINNSGARFDIEKAKWFNQQYLIKMDNADLAPLVKPYIEAEGYKVSDEYCEHFVGLLKERVHLLTEFVEAGRYFFEYPKVMDEVTIGKKYKLENKRHFKAIANLILDNKMDNNTIESRVKQYIHDNALKFGDIFPILRIAITGSTQGPDLFGMITVIGAEKCSERILKVLDTMDDLKNNLA